MKKFANTTAALAVYDAGAAERDAAWGRAETNADVEACESADRAALSLVQEAFYEDTKHINRLESCLRIDIDAMRRASKLDDHEEN